MIFDTLGIASISWQSQFLGVDVCVNKKSLCVCVCAAACLCFTIFERVVSVHLQTARTHHFVRGLLDFVTGDPAYHQEIVSTASIVHRQWEMGSRQVL